MVGKVGIIYTARAERAFFSCFEGPPLFLLYFTVTEATSQSHYGIADHLARSAAQHTDAETLPHCAKQMFCLTASFFCASIQLKLVALERAPTNLPSGWAVAGRTPPETIVEFMFAVKQTNIGRLEEELFAVSKPSSPRYGRHLSNTEVHALVAPDPLQLAAVRAYFPLTMKATPNGDILIATMNVTQAEYLLGGARYEVLVHTESGTRVHRCTRSGYSLPVHVASALDFVSPTLHLPLRSTARITLFKKQHLSHLSSCAHYTQYRTALLAEW